MKIIVNPLVRNYNKLHPVKNYQISKYFWTVVYNSISYVQWLGLNEENEAEVDEERGVLPSFLFHLPPTEADRHRIRNAGPGMNVSPGSHASLPRSKLYRSIRFSCYTVAKQKHEKVRALAFLEKFVMVQLTRWVGNIVSSDAFFVDFIESFDGQLAFRQALLPWLPIYLLYH